MCEPGIVRLAAGLESSRIKDKRVLEIGSYNVNGSVRPPIENMGPAEYIGVDITEGPSVDRIVSAENVLQEFGPESFDVVISTEMIEHVQDWRLVINNMKQVLRPNGLIFITTRSKGFPYHAYPNDFWRYEPEDMKKIFSDFYQERIEYLIEDPNGPGVLVLATKPVDWTPADLSGIELYDMLAW